MSFFNIFLGDCFLVVVLQHPTTAPGRGAT